MSGVGVEYMCGAKNGMTARNMHVPIIGTVLGGTMGMVMVGGDNSFARGTAVCARQITNGCCKAYGLCNGMTEFNKLAKYKKV